jgi:multidrug transporter EmrE-like cation transporter
MATKAGSIIMVAVCTIMTSVAQVLWKFAANAGGLQVMVASWQLWAGFLLYGLSAAVLIRSLKDGEVSVVYPVIASSYIWVALLSNHYFSEPISTFKWVGIATIVLGITVLGAGNVRVKK